MRFFTQYTEVDALKKVESINREMREISASIHANANLICRNNLFAIKYHFSNIVSLAEKYEEIKSKLSEHERTMMMGKTITSWNGEQIGIFMWEYYLSNVMKRLHSDITQLNA